VADVVATKTALSAILKEVYGPRIAEQPNRETWLLNQFNKSETLFGGKYWTVPGHFEGDSSASQSGPGAVGSYNEDEEVADAGAESYKEIQVVPKNHYALVQITGLAQAAARQNLYAFVTAKDAEMLNKVKWLVAQLNAQFYQNGSGLIGRAGASADTTHVTVSKTAAGNPDGQIPPMTQFRVGARIDMYADGAPFGAKRTTAGKKGGRKITDVTGRVLTLGAAVAGIVANETGTGDMIVYEDAQESVPSGQPGKTLSGLDILVDDVTDAGATVQNISRSTYPSFKGNVLSSGVTPAVERELSLDLLQSMLDTNRIQSGMESDFLVSNMGLRRKYLNLLWHDVRYTAQDLRGGYRTLQFDNLTWYADKDCSLGRIFCGYKDAVKKFVIKPIGILDDAGSAAERVSKKDVYEFLIGGYFNTGITQPNSWSRMEDLVDPLAA